MFKSLKQCLNTTNSNIILIIPIILIISGISAYINLVCEHITTIGQTIVSYIAFCVLISGCSSGILYTIRKTLAFTNRMFIYEQDRKEAIIYVFNSFFKGIGRTFLPILCVTIAIGGYLVLVRTLIFRFLPVINDFISYNTLSYIIFIISACIFFWFIFWIPEIIYIQRNPFKAMINSFTKCKITFKSTAKLYILICSLYLIFKIIYNILEFNPFILFFALLILYYMLYYVIILVFTYYEENFLE